MTPCVRSPAHKIIAGAVALRRQCGQNRGKVKNQFYDGSVENRPRQRDSYDASAVENQNPLQNHKTAKGVTTIYVRARLFGHKLRRQCGQTPLKTLRRQIGRKYRYQKNP